MRNIASVFHLPWTAYDIIFSSEESKDERSGISKMNLAKRSGILLLLLIHKSSKINPYYKCFKLISDPKYNHSSIHSDDDDHDHNIMEDLHINNNKSIIENKNDDNDSKNDKKNATVLINVSFQSLYSTIVK